MPLEDLEKQVFRGIFIGKTLFSIGGWKSKTRRNLSGIEVLSIIDQVDRKKKKEEIHGKPFFN